MAWNKPSWYITPEEFAQIVVEALEQTNHFKRDEAAHPEDIVIAFTSHAEAVAIGMGVAGRKMHKAEKKAVMQNGNLRKAALPQDDEIAPFTGNQEEPLGYSEWRNKKGYV